MAEVLISSTIKVSLHQVASLASDEIRLFWGFKKNLKSLKETVELISALVEDAEEKQVKDLAISLWLRSLEALACRAEHILDEVNYERLRRKVVEDPYWFKGKVSSFFSSHNQLYFLVKMVHKVHDLNTRFKELGEKAEKLGIQSRLGVNSVANATLRPSNNASPLREKDSVLGQKVIGRETEASYILDKLLNPSDEILTSIPIRGMGGLGKTTLAKLVYNDEKIDMYLKIWVGVPQNCDPVSIFRLILESLTKESAETLRGRDTIVQKIKEKLKDKKYLLVLDDVWSADRVLWDDIIESLRGISTVSGNWIIVTTREQDVAAIFVAGSDIRLDKLSSEDCLKIVKDKALISEEQNQDFEAIREDIRNLCQGLPLVASIIGGLLRTNSSKNWNSLLQKGISNMTGDEYSHVMHILRLSFDNLPSPSIKKCFAYCSLFAKDSFMEIKQLVQLWMAEGFLQRKPSDNDMEIGSECIKSLIGSSLFEEVIDEEGECKQVRMHDLVHDLAESISNPVKDLKDLKEHDRNIVIDLSGKGREGLPKMKMIRTLFMENGTLNSMLLTSFKYLHVLKLSHLRNDELPSSIRKLIHLRYLGFSDCTFETFPKSILELYNLQTLTIQGIQHFQALPEGITKLINLRHLHCDNSVSLPPKIGHLTNLQTLSGLFNISKDNHIKELGFVKNFRDDLLINNLIYVSNKEEAQQASLNRKQLTRLTYDWGYRNWFREDVDYEAVLEGLEPHPNLQSLNIFDFKGTQFPSWFMNMVVCLDQNPISSNRLDKLVSLSIYECTRCEQLPALGQLPSLKYLNIAVLDGISCIEPSFYGTFTCHVPALKVFPALRNFQLRDMPNLTEWMGYQTTDSTTEAVEIFPKIEHLTIFNCEKLRHAPIHYFHRLKNLSITRTNLEFIIQVMEKDQNCHRFPNSEGLPKRIFTSFLSLEIKEFPYVSELSEYLYGFRSLENLEIRDCSNLKLLLIPMDVHWKAQPLTSLQKLAIVGCHGLDSFPHELINSCASLSKLEIGGFCDSIKVDWPALSSISISILHLDAWPNWVSLPDQLQHLTRLLKLHLSRLENIVTLPDWFANLVSLEFLWLDGLEKLCQLPSMAAMRSLKHLTTLYITDCPLLKERCTPRSSLDSEWTKISHISEVYIDHRLIDSNADEDEVEEGKMPKWSRLRMRCF